MIHRSHGLTLLEMLIAMSIFSFMFIFISQITKQSYRQVKKIQSKNRHALSLSNALDVMRQDFRGAFYFVDINHNLYSHFPKILDKKNSQNPSSFQNFNVILKNTDNTRQHSKKFIILPKHLAFRGSHNEIKLYSYSFLQTDHQDFKPSQWLQIRYFVQNCTMYKNHSCLMRSASLTDQNTQNQTETSYVVLKKFKSISFFYADRNSFATDTWAEEWSPELIFNTGKIVTHKKHQLSLPVAVKIQIKTTHQDKSFVFPVSSTYQRTWNIIEKNLIHIPVLKTTPKKIRPQEPLRKRSLKNRVT